MIVGIASLLYAVIFNRQRSRPETNDPAPVPGIERNDNLICPRCQGTEFWSGPEGGMSINVKCVDCGAYYNYTPVFNPPLESIIGSGWGPPPRLESYRAVEVQQRMDAAARQASATQVVVSMRGDGQIGGAVMGILRIPAGGTQPPILAPKPEHHDEPRRIKA